MLRAKEPAELQGRESTDADPPQRNIPTFRLRPRMYVLGAGLICAYGWYKLVIGIREAKYVLPLISPAHLPPPHSN